MALFQESGNSDIEVGKSWVLESVTPVNVAHIA